MLPAAVPARSPRCSKPELLVQRDRLFARHPRTTFVAAHVAERAENLAVLRRVYRDNALRLLPR